MCIRDREAVDNVIEMYYMMFVQIQNDINWQNQTRDLSGANLNDAYLFVFDLFGADLSGANLNDAYLRYADLRYANLSNANLRFAFLNDADLSYADLSHADLSNANLNYANLIGVYWYNTNCPDGTNSDDNGNTCENNL